MNLCVSNESVSPAGPTEVGLDELRATVPVSVDTVVGLPDTVGVTVCGELPSLVTPMLNV